MDRIRAAAFILVSGNCCVGIGENPEAASQRLTREIDLASLPPDTCAGEEPRLALVDDPRAPRQWVFVEEFYRVWDRSVGFEIGEGDNLFSDFDEAVSAARSLDAAGFDCEVRAFHRPGDAGGLVVWGS